MSGDQERQQRKKNFLEPVQGRTAKQMLSDPTGDSLYIRVTNLFLAAAVLCFFLALAIYIFKGRLNVELLNVFEADTIDLQPFIFPLVLVGIVCLVVYAVFFFVSRKTDIRRSDEYAEIRNVIFKHLVDSGFGVRFGYTLETDEKKIKERLKVKRLGESGFDGFDVFDTRSSFSRADFAGLDARKLGYPDAQLVVVENARGRKNKGKYAGHLLVFLNQEAKRKYVSNL